MTPVFQNFLKLELELLLKWEQGYIYLFKVLFTVAKTIGARPINANIKTTCSQANKCLESNYHHTHENNYHMILQHSAATATPCCFSGG